MKSRSKYSQLIASLEIPAKSLLDRYEYVTVSDLLGQALRYGVEVPDDHHARSALGQVFRRVGAVNIGTEPATRAGAKGVRQVQWAWPSPYAEA